ncbi:lipid-binding SYLF domain-containing protein [Rhodovibrionaceae bacterium A322]
MSRFTPPQISNLSAEGAGQVTGPHPGRRTCLKALSGLALAAGLLALPESTALADDKYQDLRERVTRATTTIESMLRNEEFSELQTILPKARAVVILPQVIKGGFILGGQGGSGLLLVKGGDGTWSSPGFLTLAAGSIGLQIGGSVSEMVFAIMNDGALDAVLTNSFKFGGDVQVAAGTVGKGMGASTTSNFNADIYAYSDSVGLFGGGALEGAALLSNEEANATYYNAPGVKMDEIVLARKYNNPDADLLRSKLP